MPRPLHITPSILLLSVLLTAPLWAGPMTYPCYRPAVTPTLDGEIASDPAWQNIPAVTGFSVLGGGYTVAKQTVVQACWDDEALYIAVTAEEPDAPQMNLHVRDGGPFWEDDGVELFLRPGADKPVFQFGVTAGGARGSFLGAPDFTKFQAKSKIGRDSYSLEVRIPYEVIGCRPKVGDVWTGDFCRNTWTVVSGGDRFTCWAPLKRQFNEPENFAAIDFLGPAPAAGEAAAVSERLNAAYRANLTGRLAAAVRQGDEYIPTLTTASRDPKFGAQARDLLRQWRKAERLSKATDKASALELRKVIAGMDALARASYDLQYAYLIANVLPD
jgi:hypothetical protein